ncbi:Rho termination factor N-terminal domain-containing protein [Aeromicrobium sp.]|uniref:Rho termination factor N-terminal domain-containing protein n=1 Tax=Aeromicrobium sp. TaxID=1871063 RepID=UPI0030BB499E
MAPKSKNAPSDKNAPSRNKLERMLHASESHVEELAAEIVTLRRQVRDLQDESASWRKKAEKHRSRVQKVRATAEIAIAEATQAAKKRARKRAKAKIRQVIADHPRAEPLALRDAPPLPQPTWPVARLREAAREQGVTGYSRMRKDQLLDVLV